MSRLVRQLEQWPMTLQIALGVILGLAGFLLSVIVLLALICLGVECTPL